ncbi:MAG: aminotransferase class I/II-fold pyridoxal phosphate-dependent enzyme [Cytophagales bacterium]|nr:aminotransferase class I/II-fold pyridoxal phosphate-dependent enzyme [Cytophagales bacterium]
MAKINSLIETIDQIVTDGVKKNILHLYGGKNGITGNVFDLSGNDVINFGSCSYLGLEFDTRLKRGASNAIEKYGTQFSESRAYVSIHEYKVLEHKFDQIFQAHCVVTPTTTLGHIATIPVVVAPDDIVLLDHQVHSSIHTACDIIKSKGIKVELTRHNELTQLEEKIKAYRQKYSRVWYMADGVYSMYGDFAPVKELEKLLNTYPEFRLYIDDAHGMSTFGTHGAGYVLSQINLHPHMILATSLAKAFATGGAVMVFPDKDTARKVRTCGGPLITSGPLQPSILGAANACADIHLTNEIYELQEELQENIKYANLVARKLDLPLIKSTNAAVFFMGVSLPKVGYNLIKRMLQEGYYTNLGVFPAVPLRNTGVRFTITRLHTFEQIENMLQAMAHHLPLALHDENFDLEQIYDAFKIKQPKHKFNQPIHNINIYDDNNLVLHHYKSISEIDKTLWDSCFAGRGTFDHEGMQLLEHTFTNQELPENNWEFDYFIVCLSGGKPVLATFSTATLTKDDMLFAAQVSRQVEDMRKVEGPYHLCSKALIIGSMITEGNHLYIDKQYTDWKQAMQMLFEKITSLQDEYQANTTVIRDLDENDPQMDEFMMSNGYIRNTMPENHTVHLTGQWDDIDTFIEQVHSSKSRQYLRKETKPYTHLYQVSYAKPTLIELKYLYELYLNVQQKSLAINTFELPFTFFENIAKSPDWEIIRLNICENDVTKPIAAVFCHNKGDTYIPLIVGIDYNYLHTHANYRQSIWRVIERAKILKKTKIYLGFGATVEKCKFGAQVTRPVAYVQIKDSFNMQYIASLQEVTSKY